MDTQGIIKELLEISGYVLAKIIMPYIFNLLHLPYFPETVSTVLLGLALVLFVTCMWKTKKTKNRIKTIQQAINSDELKSEPDGINSLSNIINQHQDALYKCWKRFRMTLVERKLHGKTLVYSTTLPSNFFNLNDLGLETPLKSYAKWSGLFVGIGLLVTFLGLVAALSAATSAIEAATAGGDTGTQSMQYALKDLLSAATFKFYTSIFGLLASIFVSYSEKRLRQSLTSKIYILCQRITDIFPLLTLEELMAEQVHEAQQSTGQLKEFNSEMRQGLMELSGAMAKSLQEQVAPMREELCHVGKNIGNMEETIGRTISENLKSMQEKTLHDLANRLNSTVNQHAGAELGNLVATLDVLTKSLSGMTVSLEQGSGSFAETLKTVTTELRGAVTGLTQTTGNINQNIGDQMVESQKLLDDQLKKMNKEIGIQGQHATEQFSTSLTAITSELHKAVTGLKEATDNISKTFKSDISIAQKALTEQLVNIGKNLAEQGQKSASQLGSSTGKIITSVQSSVEEIGKHINRLSTSLQHANEALGKHHRAISDAATQTQGAAQTLSLASEILDSATAPIAQKVFSMETSLKTILENASALSNSMRQAEPAITVACKSLETTFATHLGRFKDMDEGLASALQKVTIDLNGNTSAVSAYVKEIDQYLGSALGQLAEGIQALEEVLTDYLPKVASKNSVSNISQPNKSYASQGNSPQASYPNNTSNKVYDDPQKKYDEAKKVYESTQKEASLARQTTQQPVPNQNTLNERQLRDQERREAFLRFKKTLPPSSK